MEFPEGDPRNEHMCYLYPMRNCIGDKWRPQEIEFKFDYTPCVKVCKRVNRAIPQEGQ